MSNTADKIKILVDCDVLIHFSKAEKLSKLHDLYKKRLIILDIVLDELLKYGGSTVQIRNFITFYKINILDFPSSDLNTLKEFSKLQKRFGDGESACMAVAKNYKHYIASSNILDITNYCIKNGIKYLTTMDILKELYDKKMMSIDECDEFIKKVRSKGSKLPDMTMQEYIISLQKKNHLKV